MCVIGLRPAVAIASLVVLCQATSLHGQGRATGGTLAGVVVDTMNVPVAFAHISMLDAAARIVADDGGRFRLTTNSDNAYKFVARRIGYNPVYFDLAIPAGLTVEIEIRMTPSVRTLDAVEIDEVREPLRKVGFYERMKLGHGHFVTPDMVAAMRPVRASDAFASIPGVIVDRRGSRSRLVGANYRCEFALVVDRVKVGQPGSRVRTTSPDDAISGTDIYAIEVYPANRGTPAQFLGFTHEDGCGTIVVWTKGILPR